MEYNNIIDTDVFVKPIYVYIMRVKRTIIVIKD